MKRLKYILLLAFIILPVAMFAQNVSSLEAKYQQIMNRLEFARDVELSYPDPSARTFLIEAEQALRNAKKLYTAGRYSRANRQLDLANKLIEDAARIILSNPIKTQRKKLKDLIQQAEQLLAISRNHRAEQMLTEAREHEKRSTQAFRNRQYQIALEQMRMGIFLANQAIELTKNQTINIREKVITEKKQVEQLLQKARDAVAKRPNPTADKLLALAQKRIQKAKQQFRAQNYVKVIDQYHQITRLLLRTLDIANGNRKNISLKIYDEVIQFDELADTFLDRLNERGEIQNKRLAFLVDQVTIYRQNAHQALEEQQFKNATFNVQMGRRLLERALQLINRNQTQTGIDRIGEELRDLKITLDDLDKRLTTSGDNNEAKYMFDLAKKTHQRAYTFFERRNIRLALGAIRQANRLVLSTERILKSSHNTQHDQKQLTNQINQMRDRIADLNKKRITLHKHDRAVLNEAEKLYSLIEDAFQKGYLLVVGEALQILNRQLERLPE